jgi:putative tryptophan/tyrosine transport system substrate-binding protein
MQFGQLKRRDFITLVGGSVATWPLAAHAQRPATPVIGVLYAGSPGPVANSIATFRKVLAEGGQIEGPHFTIEFRYAEGRYERLPELAVDLAQRRVALILAIPNTNAVRAAKAATTTIPILFSIGVDPVKLGLVASLSHPGGNATGVNYFLAEIMSKRLSLLREPLPAATRFGALINPNLQTFTAEAATQELTAAGSSLGVQIDVVHASDSREIESAFYTLKDKGAEALFVGPDTFLSNRRLQIATLAATHALPAIYPVREFVEAGGLMSYGTSLTEVYRQLAIYAGRILKGAKPADLPVVQSTKFELVINLPTAHALRLDIPATLLARADEVIE